MEASQTGGLKWLDLDAVEQRYLLTAAADTTVEAFDILVGSSCSKPAAADCHVIQYLLKHSLKTPLKHQAPLKRPFCRTQRRCIYSCLPPWLMVLNCILQTSHAAAGGHQQQQLKPVFTIKRGHPSAHRYQVTSISWYPVDTGLFVTGSADQHVKVWDTNL